MSVAAGPQWALEQTDRLQRGVRLLAQIAIVIFLVFWVMDWAIFPARAWDFLAIRIICAVGYIPALWAVNRFATYRALTVLGTLQIWWVSLAICAMLVLTGYERSLYYVGLMVTMLAMGVVYPWTWKNSLVVGAGMAIMFVMVAIANPKVDARAAFNNAGFLLGALGIALSANIRNERLARADFDTRLDLASANARLRELDRTKSEFFANVSHELRTPLTLILSPLEAILSDASITLPPQTRSYLVSMQRNAARLLRLINSLLDLAKLEAGKVFLRYESLSLKDFIEASVPPFEALAGTKGIELRVTVPEVDPVIVDAEKMEVVFQNLLANALKFTSSGGHVSISLYETGERVVVEVTDSGIGIAKGDLGKIFDRFAQADGSATRRFGGTGIGLALVRELVEIHGGTIGVESEVGKGTTFRVTLPKGDAHVREELRDRRAVNVPVVRDRREADRDPMASFVPRTNPPPVLDDTSSSEVEELVPSPSSGPRVLIVEDSPDLRSFIARTVLQKYRVMVAADGREGLELARREMPDLIVSDVMMPHVSGYQLSAELKGDPRTKSIPIILLTAQRGVDPALEGFKHGADDYLGKPFSTRELLARMDVQLRLRELSNKLAQAQKTSLLATLAAGLAHEVRNPVNAIVNGVPIAKKIALTGASESDAKRITKLLDVAEEAAQRILKLVQDLLDFSHLDQAKVKEWSPVKGFDSTLSLLDHRLSGVTIERSYEFGGTLLGLPGQLNQVLMNLVDNALKAVSGGGTIWIRTVDEGDFVVLEVRDSGAGIASEALPRIFDPFFTTRDVGQGTGLGLHVCKQIVEAHGGEIGVVSSAGAGASFTVRLPKIANIEPEPRAA